MERGKYWSRTYAANDFQPRAPMRQANDRTSALSLAGRFVAGKETMPEACQRPLLNLAPSEVAVLTVKFLGKNFEREKDARHGRRNRFARQLRVFDLGGTALRAANNGRGDVRVARFPFYHQLLRPVEIAVLNPHFGIRLRSRHECDLLQMTFVMNICTETGLLKTIFQPLRFGRLVKRRNRHHKFIFTSRSASSDQTSILGALQDRDGSEPRSYLKMIGGGNHL